MKTGITEQELRRYAQVILEVGVALRPGRDLAVNAHLAHADFVAVLCDEAYRRGAALVDVWYWDPHTKLARLKHAPRDTLSRTPGWLDARYKELAQRDGALINLAGDPEPDLLRGIDQARAGLDRMPGLTSRFEVQGRNEVQWSFAAVASEGWARQIFGEPDVARLWRHLADVMRLDAPDPAGAWWRRMDELTTRCAALDAERFERIHYDTLLDESAASHIAWGSGIRDGHMDYDPVRPATLDGLPINRSGTHVDFMIGGPELTVTGVRGDGSRRVVLDGERWALTPARAGA